MTKIKYRNLRFSKGVSDLIDRADQIIDDYQRQGYSLTLRQLYYRFVATDANFENTPNSYKRLVKTMTRARYAGRISWDALTDNHRKFNDIYREERIAAAVEGISHHYAPDLWQDQKTHVEVWVEKDALSDVISKPCARHNVAYMACKGYMSATQAWEGAARFTRAQNMGKRCVLLHLGDHDPSGMDMTRDNGARVHEFGAHVEVKRLALNMDQIEEYNPPPDPAKVTDSRFEKYADEFGDESWELDALEPKVIDTILDDAIIDLIDDMDAFEARQQETWDGREIIDWIGDNSQATIEWAVGQMTDEY